MIVTLEHELAGTQLQSGPIASFSASPAAVSSPAPTLGRHTDQVLRETGYGVEEISGLCAEGAVA